MPKKRSKHKSSKVKKHRTLSDLVNPDSKFDKFDNYKNTLLEEGEHLKSEYKAIYGGDVDFKKLEKWLELTKELNPSIQKLSNVSKNINGKEFYLDFSTMMQTIYEIKIHLTNTEIDFLKKGYIQPQNPAKLVFAEKLLQKANEIYGKKLGINALIVEILRSKEVIDVFGYGYDSNEVVSTIKKKMKKKVIKKKVNKKDGHK